MTSSCVVRWMLWRWWMMLRWMSVKKWRAVSRIDWSFEENEWLRGWTKGEWYRRSRWRWRWRNEWTASRLKWKMSLKWQNALRARSNGGMTGLNATWQFWVGQSWACEYSDIWSVTEQGLNLLWTVKRKWMWKNAVLEISGMKQGVREENQEKLYLETPTFFSQRFVLSRSSVSLNINVGYSSMCLVIEGDKWNASMRTSLQSNSNLAQSW